MNTKSICWKLLSVNEFARKYNLSEQEAFQYFFRFKGIDFIKENYDVEHTLDFETILEDLGMICRRNGEKTSMFLKQKKQFRS